MYSLCLPEEMTTKDWKDYFVYSWINEIYIMQGFKLALQKRI